jgi:hypothetical protein
MPMLCNLDIITTTKTTTTRKKISLIKLLAQIYTFITDKINFNNRNIENNKFSNQFDRNNNIILELYCQKLISMKSINFL